jgi:hypothetical protein
METQVSGSGFVGCFGVSPHQTQHHMELPSMSSAEVLRTISALFNSGTNNLFIGCREYTITPIQYYIFIVPI